MNEIIFSVIIPHKNTPKLLQRCINSIPEKKDVQIIVVDDNSSPEIVDFNNYPGQDRLNVECYFCTEGKGAGFARNVGLQHAKGKWLIFADADDYFTSDFYLIVLQYAKSIEDIVFFNIAGDIGNSTQGKNYQELVLKYSAQDAISVRNLKYKIWVPWAKMYLREFIDKQKLFFEERIVGNDCYFVLNANFLANEIDVSNDVIYIHTYNPSGLSHGHKMVWKYQVEILKLFIWRSHFYKTIGLNSFNDGAGVYTLLVNMYKDFGFYKFMKSLFVAIQHKAQFLQPLRYKIRKILGLVKIFVI